MLNPLSLLLDSQLVIKSWALAHRERYHDTEYGYGNYEYDASDNSDTSDPMTFVGRFDDDEPHEVRGPGSQQ